MLRCSIVITLFIALTAALAGCSREETQMPDKAPPLPGKPTAIGPQSNPPPLPKK